MKINELVVTAVEVEPGDFENSWWNRLFRRKIERKMPTMNCPVCKHEVSYGGDFCNHFLMYGWAVGDTYLFYWKRNA